MAINNNLGFKETVRALGLERRFFGFESDKSLGRRVIAEMGKITPFPNFMTKFFAPRVCIREEFEDYAAPGCISMYRVKKWTLHYNDGTKETLKTMYCQKPIGPKNTKFKGKVA